MERAVQGGVERAGFKEIENALRFRFLSRGIYVSRRARWMPGDLDRESGDA